VLWVAVEKAACSLGHRLAHSASKRFALGRFTSVPGLLAPLQLGSIVIVRVATHQKSAFCSAGHLTAAMQATERTGGLTVRSSSLGCAGRILKNLAHVTLSLRTSHLVKRSVLHSSQASTPQVLPSPAQKAAARRGELRCHATGNGAAAAVPSGPSDYASRAAGVWEQGVSQYNRFMDLAG
jgi:hypothetical protein